MTSHGETRRREVVLAAGAAAAAWLIVLATHSLALARRDDKAQLQPGAKIAGD